MGPYLVGLIKDATGSFSVGLLTISMGALLGAVVLLAVGHDRRLERIPEVREGLRGA
jgi:ACS family tartrate transporter-like MFS transporter